MLKLQAQFDLQRDVVSDVFKKEASVGRLKGEAVRPAGVLDEEVLSLFCPFGFSLIDGGSFCFLSSEGWHHM